MSDRVARILAALGLGAALLALTISGWAAMTVAQQQERLRELGESMQQRLVGGDGGHEDLPMHSPPPTLETEP